MAKTPVYVETHVMLSNFGDGWKVNFADIPWEASYGKWYKIRIPIPEELLVEDLPGAVELEKVQP